VDQNLPQLQLKEVLSLCREGKIRTIEVLSFVATSSLSFRVAFNWLPNVASKSVAFVSSFRQSKITAAATGRKTIAATKKQKQSSGKQAKAMRSLYVQKQCRKQKHSFRAFLPAKQNHSSSNGAENPSRRQNAEARR
jgi:hypothetical protein